MFIGSTFDGGLKEVVPAFAENRELPDSWVVVAIWAHNEPFSGLYQARDCLDRRVGRLSIVEIHDTLAYLLGSWVVERSIDDHRNASGGTFVGVSQLSPDPSLMTGGVVERAIYDEQGELQLGDHVGSARRRLEYRRKDDGSVSLFFLDGRHFVDLNLSSGTCEDTHFCAPDTYRIKIVAGSMCSFEEHWHVVGPHKDYEAITTYTRVSGDVV